jgi:glycosyltransferase involved in cell wall biosynthesis
MSHPKVTVLMPVYNAGVYLKDAVESILNQTFRDFEFIIINDASTDNFCKIVEKYHDPRITLIHNSKNVGITQSLSAGLAKASGRYIARMDADDVAFPARLERQLSYLVSHDVVLLGTWAQAIDSGGKIMRQIIAPIESSLLRWKLLFNNPFVHSSVIFSKKEVLEIGGYRSSFAEDYDLWSRVAHSYPIAVLPEVLLKWRDHPKSTYSMSERNQENYTDTIVKRNIELLIERQITLRDVQDLRAIVNRKPIDSPDRLLFLSDIVNDLFENACGKWQIHDADKRLVKNEYIKLVANIASVNMDFRRRNTIAILRKNLKEHRALLSSPRILRLAAKLILGPKLVPKTRQLLSILLAHLKKHQ